ncbi:MAG TPA: mycofactocin-associated electron transfer flavoprotein beta subunit [Acidimicrobiales bacterium]|jgi:electron transfer flavoprotein beta subunit|nr:mycofactocin-associated electron transfer flavoprotein beta subunit [Acidimicrobiales bacterium]
MNSSPAADGRPLVVACLRVTDQRPRVDPLTGAVHRDRWSIGWSAADAAALEHALRAAEAWGGRVLVVSAGPPTVEPVLIEAQALGASVVRVPLDEAGEQAYAEELAADEHGLARRIAAALSPFGPPALVMCGDRSADRGTGALPAFLAHELGAAQALGLVHLEFESGAPPAGAEPAVLAVLAERRLDGGWRERLRVPLPAVCSVEPAGVTLRRASLAGALAAEASSVAVDRSGDAQRHAADHLVQVGPTLPFRPPTRAIPAPTGPDPRTRVLALTGALVAHDPPTVVGPVEAPAAADALIHFLVSHGYLERPPVPATQVGNEVGR